MWWTLLGGGALRDESQRTQMKWMKAEEDGLGPCPLPISRGISGLLQSAKGTREPALGHENGQASFHVWHNVEKVYVLEASPDMGLGRREVFRGTLACSKESAVQTPVSPPGRAPRLSEKQAKQIFRFFGEKESHSSS